jgi:hypothetical protein
VLGIARHPEDCRYWYSSGPPNRTPFEDYCPLFREMLTGGQAVSEAGPPRESTLFQVAAQAVPDIEPPEDSPARRAVRQSLTYRIKARPGASESASGDSSSDAESASPYRILLRGPWQAEPLARAERAADGSLAWTTTDLPAASTVRLPAPWQDLFGDFRGRVHFRRRFHPPSNIDAGDRLVLVFDSVGGTGRVALNGHSLGKLDAAAGNISFDVTGLLQLNNEIAVELDFTSFGADSRTGGLTNAVALEIHAAK